MPSGQDGSGRNSAQPVPEWPNVILAAAYFEFWAGTESQTPGFGIVHWMN